MLSVARAAARAIAKSLSKDSDLAEICLNLQTFSAGPFDELNRRLSKLLVSERHYWIGTIYTLLLSPEQRRSQAAYFTPPYLAEAVIDLAMAHGLNLATDDVLDPAAGGAAFLSLLAKRMVAEDLRPADIAYRLNGVDIDPCLADISEALIAEQLGGYSERRIVKVGDSLRAVPLASYNLVIANPPYGRVRPSELQDHHWAKVAHSGHINKYAVFTEFCLRVAKPDGLVALVIPSSFRGGPLYDKMRSFIASQGQVLAIGSVANRKDVFADVAQDVSVLLIRKGEPHKRASTVKFPQFTSAGMTQREPPGKLPDDVSRPWLKPSDVNAKRGGATIADYGVRARAGYFVWNREQEKLAPEGSPNTYPLIWAHNIRPGIPCVPAGRGDSDIGFVQVPEGSQAVVTSPAVIIQRTTNNNQPRRIIAAAIDPSVVSRWKGFISENHTIVLSGEDFESIVLLEKLLNTRSVDERYRAVSGSANVSVTLLRELDLPTPEAFRAALEAHGNAEIAARQAYDSACLFRTAKAS